VEFGITIVGIVHFLVVEEHYTFARGDGPNEDDFMFFSSTVLTRFVLGESFLIRKSKFPNDTLLATGNTLASIDTAEFNQVHGTFADGHDGRNSLLRKKKQSSLIVHR
jgi:hypothetical protein